mgnify:CR=1 FL=1
MKRKNKIIGQACHTKTGNSVQLARIDVTNRC